MPTPHPTRRAVLAGTASACPSAADPEEAELAAILQQLPSAAILSLFRSAHRRLGHSALAAGEFA